MEVRETETDNIILKTGEYGTALFKILHPQGPTAKHRELGPMSCGWPGGEGRGVWGRMDTCICMSEFLCCPPESPTTLLVGYNNIK